MSDLLKNILRFILLLLLQVFVLNQLLIYQLVVPSIYFLFILLLPFRIPRWGLMVAGFVLGLCLDMFMDSPGLHAAACVLIAAVRPFIINLLRPDEELETSQDTPSVYSMGWAAFLTYALILTFLHHSLFFALEIFDLQSIFYLSLKILLSTALTMGMIIIFELLFASSKSSS